MATATAKAVKVSPADFERVVADLATNVLVERDNELRVIVRGLLAGVNTHMLGEPGIAKSLTLREFCKRIEGAKLFEKPIHPNLPADAVIGPYDVAGYADTGKLLRARGYLPDSDFGFLDEITRGNGPMTDALLSLWNCGERACERNGGMERSKLKAGVSASNHLFDPENQQAQAFSDRMTLMIVTEDVKLDENFKELMRRDHARRVGAMTGSYTPETFSIEQFEEAQRQVFAVTLTPEFLDAAADLRVKAKHEASLHVSPRRWLELYLVCRANAWMSGRDHVISEDLAAVEHGLWRDPADIPAAHGLVLDFHGRYEREAAKFRDELAPLVATWQSFRPKVEGTPPDEEVEHDAMQASWQTSRQMKTILKRLENVITEAKNESRDATGLLEVQNELHVIQKWYEDNNLSW